MNYTACALNKVLTPLLTIGLFVVGNVLEYTKYSAYSIERRYKMPPTGATLSFDQLNSVGQALVVTVLVLLCAVFFVVAIHPKKNNPQ